MIVVSILHVIDYFGYAANYNVVDAFFCVIKIALSLAQNVNFWIFPIHFNQIMNSKTNYFSLNDCVSKIQLIFVQVSLGCEEMIFICLENFTEKLHGLQMQINSCPNHILWMKETAHTSHHILNMQMMLKRAYNIRYT